MRASSELLWLSLPCSDVSTRWLANPDATLESPEVDAGTICMSGVGASWEAEGTSGRVGASLATTRLGKDSSELGAASALVAWSPPTEDWGVASGDLQALAGTC